MWLLFQVVFQLQDIFRAYLETFKSSRHSVVCRGFRERDPLFLSALSQFEPKISYVGAVFSQVSLGDVEISHVTINCTCGQCRQLFDWL